MLPYLKTNGLQDWFSDLKLKDILFVLSSLPEYVIIKWTYCTKEYKLFKLFCFRSKFEKFHHGWYKKLFEVFCIRSWASLGLVSLATQCMLEGQGQRKGKLISIFCFIFKSSTCSTNLKLLRGLCHTWNVCHCPEDNIRFGFYFRCRTNKFWFWYLFG